MSGKDRPAHSRPAVAAARGSRARPAVGPRAPAADALPDAAPDATRPSAKHPLQQAEFYLTAARDEQLPPPGPPEIAVAGRSNAGKSSAINALANRTRLAFASKTPGRTQQINFFRLRSGALLADLPGYGYAAVPRELKRHWQDFLARYVATRQSLVGLVLVVDARHGLADLDRRLLDGFLPSGRPALILATKIDKLTPQAQRQARDAIARAIAEAYPAHAAHVGVVGFSATRRIGIEAAEAVLGAWTEPMP
jgi:GTP-binding protein